MITLFEHANFQGRSQTLAAGRYDLPQLAIGNDRVSSVRVPPGWKVILCEHAGFQGRQRVLAADTMYIGDELNDRTSSVIVEAPVIPAAAPAPPLPVSPEIPWPAVDEVVTRVDKMKTHTEEIRARIRAVDATLEYTVEKLDLSRKIDDGLGKLDDGLATASRLLQVAALIPPIRTAVSRMRDVFDGFRASVTRAREVSGRVEKAIKPIREKLAKTEKATTQALQTCARAVRVETWSILVIRGAKQCLKGNHSDPKARALESACAKVMPIVAAMDGVQVRILEPCKRVEDAVRNMRDEIDGLGSLEAAVRRVLDELKPVLDILREIEEKLDFKLGLWPVEVSIREILEFAQKFSALLDEALDLLRPIFDRLNFNMSFDLPGLDRLENWGKGLVLDLEKFDLEWAPLAALTMDWETSFEKLEAMHEEIKRQYEGCCGRAVLALADPPQVTFYRDANYAVKLGSFGPGRYNIHTDNDTISSVQVPDGLKLTLYEHAEWQGASKSFTRDAVYVGDDFNDRTSSFVIEYS